MGSPGRRIRAEAHMQGLQGTTGTVSSHLLTVPERILKLKEIVMILRLQRQSWNCSLGPWILSFSLFLFLVS